MSLTIPACLEALGGMKGSDSPILWMSPPGSDWPPPSRPMAIHPLARPVPTVGRILVEQSEPTLLRVLARHLGWQGNHRPLMRIERDHKGKPGWVVRNLTKWHDTPVLDGDGPNFYASSAVNFIDADLSYLEALATAVVWYARIERMTKHRGPWSRAVTGPEELAAMEEDVGLPPWTVQQ